MKVGIVGLERRGRGLATRVVEADHDVVGHRPADTTGPEPDDDGVEVVDTVEALVKAIEPPRVIICCLAEGGLVDEVVAELHKWVAIDDIVIDCGDSHWQAAADRAAFLAEVDAHFLDVGASGLATTSNQARPTFAVGGPREPFETVEPLLAELADDQSVFYAGKSGSGHFVRCVHDAVQYGMVQAIAEGVEMLERSGADLDLAAVFDHWGRSAVLGGRLIELMTNALTLRPDDPGMLSTYVEDTGEVKWVLDWAMRHDIPTPVVAGAQQALMAYRDLDWPAAKAVALLRNQIGGHPVHRVEEE